MSAARKTAGTRRNGALLPHTVSALHLLSFHTKLVPSFVDLITEKQPVLHHFTAVSVFSLMHFFATDTESVIWTPVKESQPVGNIKSAAAHT